ncbi:RidA family protein [Anaeropeptidivorans aminofermentans]|uniref:RidA family protein n=1 Tax=Anaeropeptidivorans aminofermentans TaxID=2934315 RepID=UPI002023CC35|nr:RidA family protein [Anaeropeptidivorans aminofermentans]
MKEVISTSKAPAAIGPYSQAIKTGGLIFVSGQLPIDESGNLSTGTITEQTKIVMNNVSEILKAAGSGLDKIVKTTILLTDLGVFGEVNEAYGEFFTNEPPARACFQVAALPKNAQIEIEVIAAV